MSEVDATSFTVEREEDEPVVDAIQDALDDASREMYGIEFAIALNLRVFAWEEMVAELGVA